MKKLFLLLAGLAFFGGSSGGTRRPAVLAPLPKGLKKYHLDIRARQLKYINLFEDATAAYPLVPLQMALAVGHGEGSGKPDAISSAGAVGLMQLMPATARWLGLKVNKEVDQRYTPHLNVLGGVKLLSILYKKYKDWDKVLAAYNSGSPNTAKRAAYINYIRSFLPLYAGFR